MLEKCERPINFTSDGARLEILEIISVEDVTKNITMAP